MKIINASYSIIDDKDFANPLAKIERIARICYKSEDKITETSYLSMVETLIKRNHLAMLEHASLTFKVDEDMYLNIKDTVDAMCDLDTTGNWSDCYELFGICRLKFTVQYSCDRYIISGNIRAWYEFFAYLSKNTGMLSYDAAKLYSHVNKELHNIMHFEKLETGSEPSSDIELITDFSTLTRNERLVHETFTAIFTCDRGVTHELVRMRDASFAQESTRYCNYQLGKFGNEITVIKPPFFDEHSQLYVKWFCAMSNAEASYNELIAANAKPQEARSVLPTSVKADIAVTANLQEWKHILELRAQDSTGPAHPQMKELMVPLFEEVRVKYPNIFTVLPTYNPVGFL